MGQGDGGVGDGVDIEEDGAGNVRGLVFGARIALAAGQVPAPVEDDEVGIVEMVGEPVGGDEPAGTVGHGPSCIGLPGGASRGQGEMRRIAFRPWSDPSVADRSAEEPPMIDQTTLITYVAIVLGFRLHPRAGHAAHRDAGGEFGDEGRHRHRVGDRDRRRRPHLHGDRRHFGAHCRLGDAVQRHQIYRRRLPRLPRRARHPGEGADRTSSGAQPPISAGKAYRQAILAEVLNPKTALFFLAFLPQFVRPENGSVALQLIDARHPLCRCSALSARSPMR